MNTYNKNQEETETCTMRKEGLKILKFTGNIEGKI